MKKAPWYSVKGTVHHVCTNCTEGDNIQPENKRQGNGNKPLCDKCQTLIDASGC